MNTSFSFSLFFITKTRFGIKINCTRKQGIVNELEILQDSFVQFPTDGSEFITDGNRIGNDLRLCHIKTVGFNGNDNGLVGRLIGLDTAGQRMGIKHMSGIYLIAHHYQHVTIACPLVIFDRKIALTFHAGNNQGIIGKDQKISWISDGSHSNLPCTLPGCKAAAETKIEQGGTNVSGGQKQRLCIARALIKKPKILILDDSTSAVDTKTDALIRQGFKEFIPETTKIIIAQRISSVKDADMIVVMENGRISDMGNHEELLSRSEIYKEIYEQQTNGGDSDE